MCSVFLHISNQPFSSYFILYSDEKLNPPFKCGAWDVSSGSEHKYNKFINALLDYALIDKLYSALIHYKILITDIVETLKIYKACIAARMSDAYDLVPDESSTSNFPSLYRTVLPPEIKR